MKKFIYILFSMYFFIPIRAQQSDSVEVQIESKGMIFVSNVILIIPGTFLLVSNHEFGHYTIASIFGAQNLRTGLRLSNGTGWTTYSNNIGRFGTAATSVGGVLFSRGLAEGSDCMIRHVNLPSWGQRFFSITFILGRLDFATYLLRDTYLNLSGKNGSDIDILVTQIAGHNGNSRFFTYSALFTLATFDLIIDWNRIVLHMNILKGKPYSDESLGCHTQFSVHPYLTENSFGIRTQLRW